VDPTTLSAGYRFTGPGDYDEENPDKWQVSSYMFSPADMTVMQGDTVTLRTFVLNGDTHAVRLLAPDGSEVGDAEVWNRGREYNLTFTADQAGYYTLICDTHGPTMTTQILALPASGEGGGVDLAPSDVNRKWTRQPCRQVIASPVRVTMTKRTPISGRSPRTCLAPHP
jgi:plastocyanin